MNKQELNLRLEQNIKSKFSYIPRAIHSMEVLSGIGPLIINSHLASDMFNIVCCEKNGDLGQVESAINYFLEKHLPAAWWVGFHSDPKNLKEKLESMSLKIDR